MKKVSAALLSMLLVASPLVGATLEDVESIRAKPRGGNGSHGSNGPSGGHGGNGHDNNSGHGGHGGNGGSGRNGPGGHGGNGGNSTSAGGRGGNGGHGGGSVNGRGGDGGHAGTGTAGRGTPGQAGCGPGGCGAPGRCWGNSASANNQHVFDYHNGLISVEEYDRISAEKLKASRDERNTYTIRGSDHISAVRNQIMGVMPSCLNLAGC